MTPFSGPNIAGYGVWVSQHDHFGAIPPPTFSKPFPLGRHAKWTCDTPPHKWGISAIHLRDTT